MGRGQSNGQRPTGSSGCAQKSSSSPCCALPWRCVQSLAAYVRRRHCVSFLLGLCLLYGLYVLVQTRLLEGSVLSHENLLRAIYWGSTAKHPARPTWTWRSATTLPPSLETCARPPPGSPWLVDTPGCVIPAHQPFSDDVREFVWDFPNVTCADPPPLVRSNDTHLMMETSVVPLYNVTNATCCYTHMWRYPGPDWQSDPGLKGPLHDHASYGNDIRFSKECVPFREPVAVPHEFVRVMCSSKESTKVVYQDYHGFIPVKRPRGHPAGVTDREYVSEAALNVLIVGIDSISRLNMIRKMPKTRAFLEERLGARSFLGYNKVEDNTFPNLVAMLAGMSVPELRSACWPNDTTHFDACPWVWKRFNREGYVNMFAEDTAWMGLFHYIRKGFVNQPTDYDPRPLLYLGERDLGRGGGHNACYCIGQRHQVEVLFDYSLKFARAMATQRRKFFGLVWGTSLSHDLLNQPDEADAFYERLLADLLATGLFNTTAVIFMSDHGLRFGSILNTFQGHLENLLPVMYVMLPEWARRRYPEAARNLDCNRHSLVTVFDLHRTFEDFMDLRSLEDARVRADAARVKAAFAAGRPPRGVSLFTPIPGSRTCDQAGIPTNYCACQHLTKADPGSPDVLRAVKFVVSHVNQMLSVQPKCWRLRLGQVMEARRGPPVSTDFLSKQDANGTMEYQLTFRTQPGDALFRATVRRHIKTGRMRLAGSIGRLNAYGNTSWCAMAPALRTLCFCRDPAPTTTTTLTPAYAMSTNVP